MEDTEKRIDKDTIKKAIEEDFAYVAKIEAEEWSDGTYDEIAEALEEGREPQYRESGIVSWAQDNLSIYRYPEWEKEYGLSQEEIEEMFGGEENIIDIAIREDRAVFYQIWESVEETL